MLIALYVILSHVIKLDIPYYQLFLLLGIIVWNFFSEATQSSLNSIDNWINMLKKVKVPFFYLILSTNIASLFTFFSNILIFIWMMFIFGVNLSTPLRMFSFFYFCLLFSVVFCVSLIVSTIYLYFKDIKHIWSFVLLIGFWITPIIYSEKMIPENILSLYMLNPLARIISHLRNTLIYNYIDSFHQIIISLIIIFTSFFISLLIYRKYSKKIYEML